MSALQQNVQMRNEDFKKLSSFVYAGYGIKLPPAKKTMLEGRLQKRLRALNMLSFKEYCDYVLNPEGQEKELTFMINAITTNKTDFFREPEHFNYLTDIALPEFVAENPGKHLKVWSAGCSTGEEAYTLSMVISEFNLKGSPVDFSILATDVSTDVLTKGKTAVYAEERIENIPLALKRKHFLKHKDPAKRTVRVVPELRSRVNFERLNFMDDTYGVRASFDIIMCRNVLIYFDKRTQEKVINKLAGKLKEDGYFFLGHSESITDMDVPLLQIKPTVFRKI